MTSELLVMNREAVVLAADSAVTLGNGKIFNSANKIFRLIPGIPIGLMVYNKADFMGIPWETIIELYRESRRNQNPYDTVEEWKNDFLVFLSALIPDEEGDSFFGIITTSILISLCNIADNYCSYLAMVQEKVSEEEIKKVLAKVINSEASKLATAEPISCLDKQAQADFAERARPIVNRCIQSVIKNIEILSPDLIETITSLAIDQFTKVTKVYGRPTNAMSSGIVFTGFGKKEWFPIFYSLIVIGKVFGELLICDDRCEMVSHLPEEDACSVSICAFAQHDMISLFMNGIDLDILSELDRTHTDIFGKYPPFILDIVERELQEAGIIPQLDDGIKRNILEHLGRIAQKNRDEVRDIFSGLMGSHSEDVVDVVAHLPKDELAEFAETLVNLTSFKRHISADDDTVGGPVDVATISKKDGFIWIKRKHYFEAALNPHILHAKVHTSRVNEITDERILANSAPEKNIPTSFSLSSTGGVSSVEE